MVIKLPSYDVIVDGVSLRPILLEVSTSESVAEFAGKAQFVIAIHPTRRSVIQEKLPSGKQVAVYADNSRVFLGRVFSREYDEAASDRLTILAYDKLIYLTKSDDDIHFDSNTTALTMIQEVVGKYEIGLGDTSGVPDVILPVTIFQKTKAADIVQTVLDAASYQVGTRTLVRADGELMDIVSAGGNAAQLTFTPMNSVQATDHGDIEDTITRVRIVSNMSNPNDETGAPTPEEDYTPPTDPLPNPAPSDVAPSGSDPPDPDPSVYELPPADPPPVGDDDKVKNFGLLQKILYVADYPSYEETITAAYQTLIEKGDEHIVDTVIALDVPWVRKGDTHNFQVGTLSGLFTVTGVEHNGKTGLMTMTIDNRGFIHQRKPLPLSSGDIPDDAGIDNPSGDGTTTADATAVPVPVGVR